MSPTATPVEVDLPASCGQCLRHLLKQPIKVLAKQGRRLSQSAPFDKRNVLEIVPSDSQARRDVVTNRFQPLALLVCESAAGSLLTLEPRPKPLAHNICEWDQ